MAAIVNHGLTSNRCGRVIVDDLNIEFRHFARIDILKHHIGEQIGPVVDIALSGLLDAAGLVLDLPGPNDAHVVGLNVGRGGNITHTGHFDVLSIDSDKHLSLGTVDGVFCQQIAHIRTSLS